MRKLLTDHFDKLLMTLIFFVMFAAALIYSFEWLASLTRDAFLVLTALLGFRRQPAQSANTTTGDVIVQPAEETKEEGAL
jgi:hypothetical protein